MTDHPKRALPTELAALRSVFRTIRPVTPDATEQAIAIARVEIEARRRRRMVFAEDEDLLGDPVWDALLELFVAEVDGRPLSIGSLCTAMHLPQSTGLRWIAHMEERDLVTKALDGSDRRRLHVFPTDHARQVVIQSLEPLWTEASRRAVVGTSTA